MSLGYEHGTSEIRSIRKAIARKSHAVVSLRLKIFLFVYVILDLFPACARIISFLRFQDGGRGVVGIEMSVARREE